MEGLHSYHDTGILLCALLSSWLRSCYSGHAIHQVCCQWCPHMEGGLLWRMYHWSRKWATGPHSLLRGLDTGHAGMAQRRSFDLISFIGAILYYYDRYYNVWYTGSSSSGRSNLMSCWTSDMAFSRQARHLAKAFERTSFTHPIRST